MIGNQTVGLKVQTFQDGHYIDEYTDVMSLMCVEHGEILRQSIL